MRTFTDDEGTVWTAALGRESWGTFVVLFSPAAGGAARKAALAAEDALGAQRELEALSTEQLRARLAASEPWGE
jgi:hypothetical protein